MPANNRAPRVRLAVLAGVAGLLFVAAPMLAPLAAEPGTPPLPAGFVSGGEGRVAAIVDGDTLLLGDGREVRLQGIQAPKLPLGREAMRAWPLGANAKAFLARLTLDRRVTLHFGGARVDRHGRILAQLARDDGLWVQGALLIEGLGRVYSFRDNREGVAAMLALERDARAERKGMWAHEFYTVRDVNETKGLIDSFQIVEGVVVDAARVRGRTYLNFGADWRTDFTVSIGARAARLFDADGIEPLSYQGRLIRVRGWIDKRNGPLIEATHPEQIEVIE